MNVNIPPHPTPQSYSGLRSSRSLDKPIYTHTYRDRLSEHWWMVRATAWEQNTKELLWLYPQIHKTTTNNYILILLHNLTCNDYNSHVLKSSFCFWTRLGSDSQLIFRMASHYWHNIYILWNTWATPPERTVSLRKIRFSQQGSLQQPWWNHKAHKAPEV